MSSESALKIVIQRHLQCISCQPKPLELGTAELIQKLSPRSKLSEAGHAAIHCCPWASCLTGDHSVVEAVMTELLMAVDAGVGERSIFVAAEGEYGLVHLLRIEHLESHK